jgi:hypothetical protein
MSLTTLAIHLEAWLQEELGAQQAVLAMLGRLESAARSGSSADLERIGSELEELLAPAGQRDVRRGALVRRLGEALGIQAHELDLTRVCSGLEAARVDSNRIQRLRGTLRGVVTEVVRTGRRLAAMAQYHRGVFEEICQILLSGAPGGQDHLIDACA